MSSSGWGSIRNKDPIALADLPTPLNTISVDTWDELVTALDAAVPGDHIVADAGVLIKTTKTFSSKVGTPTNPIVVRPTSVGTTVITGTGSLRFNNCQYLQWYGFVHSHAADTGQAIRFDNCSNSRFARNEVSLSGATASYWFMMSGTGPNTTGNNRIDHNYFHDKSTDQGMLNIGNFAAVNRCINNTVEYNHFNTHSGTAETVLFGSDVKDSPTYYNTLFQHNLIADVTSSDGEMISIKSCGNTVYHNSFINNASGTVSLRHGHFNKVMANYFDNSGGIILSGSNHIIIRNHFKNMVAGGFLAPITLRNGDRDTPGLPGNPGSIAYYEQVQDCRVAMNTIVNGSSSVQPLVVWGYNANTFKPTDVAFEGNIIDATSGTLFNFDNSATSATNTFADNILYTHAGAATVGNMGSGYTDVDPQLTIGAGGLYRIAVASPGRNLITAGVYTPYLETDIDGEDPNSSSFDAGSDEYTTNVVYPLHTITLADVGPDAP